jgi:hypothetical protein
MKVINTKYATKCADVKCGAEIAVGQKVKWYGRGKVYGFDCHDKSNRLSTSWVATTSTGAEIYQNRLGRCIDAPCCGCCN